MTAAQARTLFRVLTVEHNTTVVDDEDRIDHLLDAGIEALNARVGASVEDQTVTLVDGTQEYTLGTDALSVVWVEHNGHLLEKTDQDRIRQQYPTSNWRNEKGTPKQWYLTGRKIGFFPKPNAAAVAAGDATARVITKPNGVADGTSGLTVFCDQHHRLIVHYAAALWFASPNGGMRTAAAKAMFDLFEAEAALAAASYAEQKLPSP